MRAIQTLLFLATFPAMMVGRDLPRPAAATTPPITAGPAATGFEENKGQVRTTAGEAASFVRFRLAQGNTQLFLLQSGIAYQFSRAHVPPGVDEAIADREHVRLETYRMDMQLEGANPSARITTEGRSNDYTQFYNHNALDVHSYTKVSYHDVYPGIDWVVYTTEKGMKYDFVVHPGADPNAIRLRFDHHEELALDAEGKLIFGNRMGRFTEEHPVSFQEGKAIATRFVLEGNRLSFAPGAYDRAKELIIDPELAWATYYGEASPVDHASDVKLDDNTGDVIMVGSTSATTGIAQGGYQNTMAGAWDGYVVKFNSAGVRLWSSYYGGDLRDHISSCAVDGQGNILFAGNTRSHSNIAHNGHQNTFTAGETHFLVKMNAAGGLLWATYYGNSDDGAVGNSPGKCATDADGNIYLAGRARPGTGYTTPGSHQPEHGGAEDLFLAKFSPDGTRLWGTFYGGEDEDGTNQMGLAVDPSGAVYLGGSTNSSMGIASAGHQNVFGGNLDAYLVKFTSTGTRVWATYYGGSAWDEFASCTTDGEGNVYMAGHTYSTTGIAWQGFQNTPASTFDAFLVKFNAAGERSWGTYYGGEAEDRAVGCATDASGNVYLSGWTQSTTGLAFEGYQSANAGGSDAFIARFDGTGARTWGTFYGGPAGEYMPDGDGLAVGANGRVCIVGWTSSASGIAFNGHQNTLSATTNDYLAVFDGDGPTLHADPIDGPVCAGSPVSVTFTGIGDFNGANIFTAQLSDASGSFASPVDIGSVNGTTSGTIEATIPAGTVPDTGYRIRVVASNPATIGEDNGADIEVAIPGSPCDDGDPETTGDVINSDCVCAGVPECSTVADLQESEPNGDASQANPLPQGTTISGSIGACSPTNSSADQFHITPTSQGVMRVDACLSTTGSEPVDVTFVLSISTGNVVAIYTLPAGANGTAITSFFEWPCMGSGDYYINVQTPSGADCMHYALSYTTIVPAFGNDPAPNMDVAYDTYQDGQNGFHGEPTSTDLFRIEAPMDGRLVMEVQAEQAAPTPGELQVRLYTTTGYMIKEWVLPSGASGVPDTTVVSADCLAEGGDYDVRFFALDCGTSYRWKYTVTPPVFAGEVEPNNTTANAVVLAAGTPGTGHIDFLPQLEGTGDNADYIRMDLPSDGVLHVNVEAEHGDAATDGTLQVKIMQSTGAVLADWEAPVGANSTPSSSSFSLPCMGTAIPYYIHLVSSTCGVSYRISWSVTPPHYANDAEPNNYYDIGIPMDLSGAWYDGHIGFHYTTDNDYYRFTHAGVDFSVTVSAEHVGAEEGTMELVVMSSTGAVFGNFVVPVGGSSAPLTNTFTVEDLPAGSNYSIYFSAVTCGVSYRIHCATDADEDGVCDVADVCPGGPEPGTPCDDGDQTTVNDVITTDCACEGDVTTGIDDTDTKDGMRLWPNPATDALWLQVDHARGAAVTVMVRDLTGRLVIAQASLLANAQGQLLVDLSPLTPGTYVIEVQANGQRWSRRVVKA